MKTTVFALAVVLATTACTQRQKKTEGFIINGTLTGDAENAKVTLMNVFGNSETILDSTQVQNGQFQLKGKVDEPEMYQIWIALADTTLDEVDANLAHNFYLENSEITFEADVATMPSFFYSPERTIVMPTITGSATEDLNKKLKNEQKEVSRKLAEVRDRIIEVYHRPSLEGKEDVEAGIRYQTELEHLMEENEKITMNFMKENPSSPIALDQVVYWLDGKDRTPDEWDEIMALFKPHWEGNARYEELNKEIEKKKNMGKGMPLPDAEFLTEKGEKVMLSSYIPQGKYTLVEFWASWCGPCRGEIPHLKKIQEKYPEFEIVSISIDQVDADWRKALAEEKMTWPQLHNPAGFVGVTQDVYGITGIPAGFVLDGEGKIQISNARGPKLEKFVSELYAN